MTSKVPLLNTIFISAMGKFKQRPENKMKRAAGSLHLCLAATVEPEIGIIYFIHTRTSSNIRQLGLNTLTNAPAAENV